MSGDLNNAEMAEGRNCSVCGDLLTNLGRFFDMLETARRSSASDWMTVEEIATELKISKSVVYRLIRNGQLEAVDLVETNGEVAQKGHYRITRLSLSRFLKSKKVRPLSAEVTYTSRSRHQPKPKNHLGL